MRVICRFVRNHEKNSLQKANQDDTSQWSRLWKVVNSTKISTAEEGFNKVHEQGQKFAFLWDVAIIEYKILTDEDCSLTTVKSSIFEKETANFYHKFFSTCRGSN